MAVRKKKPELDDYLDPALRKKLAPIEPASGRVGVAYYNKLVEERNQMAEALLRVARQTVQFSPPLHLLRPDRRDLLKMITEPLGIEIRKEEE